RPRPAGLCHASLSCVALARQTVGMPAQERLVKRSVAKPEVLHIQSEVPKPLFNFPGFQQILVVAGGITAVMFGNNQAVMPCRSPVSDQRLCVIAVINSH